MYGIYCKLSVLISYFLLLPKIPPLHYFRFNRFVNKLFILYSTNFTADAATVYGVKKWMPTTNSNINDREAASKTAGTQYAITDTCENKVDTVLF